jgi:hypothetical protein
MPSPWHDGVVQIFRDEPNLAVRILRDCAGADVPAGLTCRLESAAFNDRPSSDFAADTVIVMGPQRQPAHAAVVEAQQLRDEQKRSQLPRYAAAVWLLLRCAVDVLIICPDQATADWYARPIATTLAGYSLHPRAIGPEQVPPVTDSAVMAASPGLGALSVAMHGREPAVARAFMAGLAALPASHAPAYYENAYGMAPPAIRQILEDLMSTTTWPVNSPFAKEHFGRGKAEGQAEGEAEAILLVLNARSLPITAAEQSRITSCSDLAQLRQWVSRAATVASASELFA